MSGEVPRPAVLFLLSLSSIHFDMQFEQLSSNGNAAPVSPALSAQEQWKSLSCDVDKFVSGLLASSGSIMGSKTDGDGRNFVLVIVQGVVGQIRAGDEAAEVRGKLTGDTV